MARPRKPKAQKAKNVAITMTPAEHRALRMAALAEEKPVSQFIRERCLGGPKLPAILQSKLADCAIRLGVSQQFVLERVLMAFFAKSFALHERGLHNLEADAIFADLGDDDEPLRTAIFLTNAYAASLEEMLAEAKDGATLGAWAIPAKDKAKGARA